MMRTKLENTEHTMIRFNSCPLWCFLALTMGLFLLDTPVKAEEDVSNKYHYLRGAYQYGTVLQTNEFVEGDNLKGESVDDLIWIEGLRQGQLASASTWVLVRNVMVCYGM
jgi:hypothetical protein